MKLSKKDESLIEEAIEDLERTMRIFDFVPSTRGYETKKYNDIDNRVHNISQDLQRLQARLRDLIDRNKK